MRVIVLPGLDGTGRLLAEFAEAICKTHDVTVIAYPEDMTSYERIVDWLLPCLPPEEYVIVAESFSGPAATRIALERPAHLRGVVFVATFLRAPVRLPIWSIRWLRNLAILSTSGCNV